MELIVVLCISAVLLLVTFCIGSSIEQAHLRSLVEREAHMKDMLLTTLEEPVTVGSAECPPKLVTGEAVISSDYFKTWLFGFQNIFGGESQTFTRLFDRARREALLRMVDEARAAGYDAICNIRFESSDIGGNAVSTGNEKKQPLKLAACAVSGTAYRRP